MSILMSYHASWSETLSILYHQEVRRYTLKRMKTKMLIFIEQFIPLSDRQQKFQIA